MPNYTRPPATELASLEATAQLGVSVAGIAEQTGNFSTLCRLHPHQHEYKKIARALFGTTRISRYAMFLQIVSCGAMRSTTHKSDPSQCRQEMDQLTCVSARMCVFGELRGHDLHESGAENERIRLSTFARSKHTREIKLCARAIYIYTGCVYVPVFLGLGE
jgi:hypothetical protein